jgi:hypothetical protein
VLITVPAFPVLWTHHDELNRHFVRYRKRTLDAVVERAGLRTLASRYSFHWLFPVKLAVRGVELVSRREGAPAKVPPPWLNRILLGVTRLEQQALERSDLPFGSSLLAWCAPPDGEMPNHG